MGMSCKASSVSPRRHRDETESLAVLQSHSGGESRDQATEQRAEHEYPASSVDRSGYNVEPLREMLSGGYLLQPADEHQAVFTDALTRLWADGGDPNLLARFRRLIERLYPPGEALTRAQRQRLAEQDILTVYLHAHMDEDTLDLSRLVACPDQVPDTEGRLIPACAYNLFYRMRDERFYAGGQRDARPASA